MREPVNRPSSRQIDMKLLIILLTACAALMVSPNRGHAQTAPATLRRIATDYYDWRNRQFPVASSDAGLHTWDSKLTDYSPPAIAARRAHVINLLAQINRMQTAKWKK